MNADLLGMEENLNEERRTKKQLKAMAYGSIIRKVFAQLAGRANVEFPPFRVPSRAE